MAKTFTNQEIADLLHRVSAAYEILDKDQFRVSAYDKAAFSIEHATSEVKDYWDEKRLEEIPGVGRGIALYLDELFRKGKVHHFESLFSKLPPAMFIFLKIPGIGAKTAYALAKNLKIKNERNALSLLKKAAQKGKIRDIENFKEKSEENILKGIEQLEKGERKTTRMLLPYADTLAREIISYLKDIPEVLQADCLGSLRRMVSTVGDIDLAIATTNPKKVMEHFFKFSQIKQVLNRGEELLGRVVLFSGQQVDIRLSSPQSYGAMLQYFTGSKAHNIALREYALKKGFSLSEYGIKKTGKKGKLEKFCNETDFYNYLGMDCIPPEIREDTGEIRAAVNKSLPILVETKDIKGDFHLHSNFPIEPSHDLGESNPLQMIGTAEVMGYEYLGFSEHNPSFSKHTNNQIINILKRKKGYFDQLKYSSEKENNKRTNKLPIKIFNGLEIDIKPNGELSIPDKGFDYLDYAIVSIHTSMSMSRSQMTQRVIKGLSHPKAKIFGHPTGRKLNQREGYELDWEKIFDFCLKNNKILEISSWPERLDLPDFLVREAVKRGVKMIINSDAHSSDQMGLMPYGVSVARRGWAEKDNIVNTLNLNKISDILLK